MLTTAMTSEYLLVAPFTGAWIEIIWEPYIVQEFASRSLHGSVD